MVWWWDIPVNHGVILDFDLDNATTWHILCHLLIVLSFFSFLLAGFTFFTYLLFKQKFPSRLITYFSFITSANAAALLVLPLSGGRVLTSDAGCVAQGIFNQFCAMSSVFWWFCITINLYASFVKNKKIAHLERYMHLFCWGGPAILTALPAFFGKMNVVGLWCWVDDFAWQMAAYYAWMGLCWFFGTIMWIAIIASLVRLSRRYKQVSDRSSVNVQVLRQSIFVFWFLMTFLFMFVHRVVIHSANHSPVFLMALHIIAMASQGIFVFLVFGIRLEIAWYWRNLFLYRCCGRVADYESLE